MTAGDVVCPGDARAAGELLKQADQARLSVAVRGSGTKSGWGTETRRADVTLSTASLASTIDHVAGDLTATVAAGATLDAVNEVLRRHDQWLPLDPPLSDRATIGGIVATNDSGPRRHKFGAPRDMIIGVEMALVDGRTAKAGGRVVKNVAGYDLSRLLCGSFGTLALVTSATFKLAPVAPASRTVVATLGDLRRLGELALALAAAPIDPSAVEIESPPHRLLLRLETTPSAADRQAEVAAAMCRNHGAAVVTLAGGDEHALWREHETRMWGSAATLVKLSVLPTEVGGVLDHVQRASAARGVECRTSGRASLGVLHLRLAGDLADQVAVITGLRSRISPGGGHAVLLTGAAALTSQIPPWGDAGDALPIMRAVKARFDPNGTLNPGRGPWGL